MTEGTIFNHVRLDLSPKTVLWRNNRGVAVFRVPGKKPRFVHYGVGPDGASDSVGYTKEIITQDMVGKQVAIFTVIEIKTLEGEAREDQIDFVNQVKADGGYGGFANCIEQARKIFGRQ